MKLCSWLWLTTGSFSYYPLIMETPSSLVFCDSSLPLFPTALTASLQSPMILCPPPSFPKVFVLFFPQTPQKIHAIQTSLLWRYQNESPVLVSLLNNFQWSKGHSLKGDVSACPSWTLSSGPVPTGSYLLPVNGADFHALTPSKVCPNVYVNSNFSEAPALKFRFPLAQRIAAVSCFDINPSNSAYTFIENGILTLGLTHSPLKFLLASHWLSESTLSTYASKALVAQLPFPALPATTPSMNILSQLNETMHGSLNILWTSHFEIPLVHVKFSQKVCSWCHLPCKPFFSTCRKQTTLFRKLNSSNILNNCLELLISQYEEHFKM